MTIYLTIQTFFSPCNFFLVIASLYQFCLNLTILTFILRIARKSQIVRYKLFLWILSIYFTIVFCFCHIMKNMKGNCDFFLQLWNFKWLFKLLLNGNWIAVYMLQFRLCLAILFFSTFWDNISQFWTNPNIFTILSISRNSEFIYRNSVYILQFWVYISQFCLY